MTAVFRNYSAQSGFTEDFYRVREFLIRINQKRVTTPGFLWGRWEWAFSLPYLDRDSLDRIGVWEDEGTIVALVTYEDATGEGFFCTGPRYEFLKGEMLDYARENLSKDGNFRALIDNNDRAFQRMAYLRGYRPTQEKQCTAMMDIDGALSYRLPQGYGIHSLADECDLQKFNRCLYYGFNHPGEAPADEKDIRERLDSLSGPHLRRDLNMVVTAPDGEYAAYCGIWYEDGTHYALVEPVCTVPHHRKMGCGRAAVLEAVRRCGCLGARQAYVGSSQQFYYNIGFYPVSTETWWTAPPR